MSKLYSDYLELLELAKAGVVTEDDNADFNVEVRHDLFDELRQNFAFCFAAEAMAEAGRSFSSGFPSPDTTALDELMRSTAGQTEAVGIDGFGGGISIVPNDGLVTVRLFVDERIAPDGEPDNERQRLSITQIGARQ